MMYDRDYRVCDCLYTIEQIKATCKPIFASTDFVAKVYLFGSYARGESTPQSDLDFMVVLNRDDVGLRFYALYPQLQEALGKDVDVLTEEEVYRILPETFERDSVLIFSKE